MRLWLCFLCEYFYMREYVYWDIFCLSTGLPVCISLMCFLLAKYTIILCLEGTRLPEAILNEVLMKKRTLGTRKLIAK